MSRVQLVSNRVPQAKAHVRRAVQTKTLEAADSLLEFVVAALDAGDYGITSDKEVLAQSLYVAATGREDYDEARNAAKRTFAQNPGAHAEKVSQKMVANFESLLASREELPSMGPNVFVCALCTMVAYGLHWETDGGRPWLEPATFAWVQQKARSIFEELRGELR